MRLPGSKALIHQDTGTTHLLQKLGTLKYLGQLRPNWWQKLALWTSSSLEDSAAVLHSLVRYKTQFFELPVRNEGSGAKIDGWFGGGGGGNGKYQKYQPLLLHNADLGHLTQCEGLTQPFHRPSRIFCSMMLLVWVDFWWLYNAGLIKNQEKNPRPSPAFGSQPSTMGKWYFKPWILSPPSLVF